MYTHDREEPPDSSSVSDVIYEIRALRRVVIDLQAELDRCYRERTT